MPSRPIPPSPTSLTAPRTLISRPVACQCHTTRPRVCPLPQFINSPSPRPYRPPLPLSYPNLPLKPVHHFNLTSSDLQANTLSPRMGQQEGRPLLRPRRLHPHLLRLPPPRLPSRPPRLQGQGRRHRRRRRLQRPVGHVRLG